MVPGESLGFGIIEVNAQLRLESMTALMSVTDRRDGLSRVDHYSA